MGSFVVVTRLDPVLFMHITGEAPKRKGAQCRRERDLAW